MSRLFAFVAVIGCLGLLAAPRMEAQQPGGASKAAPAQRPATAIAAQAAAPDRGVAGKPDWFPLSPEHEEYLNGILKYWEYQASQVQRYRCTFWRWEYDPVMLPLNPNIAVTVAQGKIQYQAPDKGKFEVEKLWDVAVQQQGETRVPILENENPKYVARQEVLDDHWVCDGQAIFQFDGRNKQIIKRLLPPEMKGKQIADGPLPFLFGAKADTLKQRYWIHVLPPRKQGVFRLEAVPKTQVDAADYRSIIVYIDEKEFLPEGLELIARAGGRTTFEFKERETNWNLVPEMLTFWRQQFYEPKPPAGWKLVNEPVQGGPPMGPAPAAANAAPPAPRQATKAPAAAPPRR